MAATTKVLVFRAANDNVIQAETGTVEARLIDALYEQVGPKGSGECVILIKREAGARFYTVDTQTDADSKQLLDTLTFLR